MRPIALVSLFAALTTWTVSASPSLVSETTDEQGGIIHYLEEIETPDSVVESLWAADVPAAREDRTWGEKDPLDDLPGGDDDFLDPLDPIPDDFDLPLPIPGPIGGGSEALVILEQIVNLGERVWRFVERNKPVLNIKRAYANALPQGVRSGQDLEGFSPLTYRSYRMSGVNGFKNKVYDVTYTLVHRYGGQYENAGRYLEHATVLPHKVEALWGYTVDVGVDNVGVVNVGTREAPVGGLTMELAFRVSTVIKASETRNLYEFRGDSRTVTSINNDGSDAAGEQAPVHVVN